MKKILLQVKFDQESKMEPDSGIVYRDGKIRMFPREWQEIITNNGREVLKKKVMEKFEKIIDGLLF